MLGSVLRDKRRPRPWTVQVHRGRVSGGVTVMAKSKTAARMMVLEAIRADPDVHRTVGPVVPRRKPIR